MKDEKDPTWTCRRCGDVATYLPDGAGRPRCPNDGCDEVLKWTGETPRIRRNQKMLVGPPRARGARLKEISHQIAEKARESEGRRQAAARDGRVDADAGRELMARVEEREREIKSRAGREAYQRRKRAGGK